MCYAIEYLIKEASEKAAKEAAILTLIECYREVDMTESEIEDRVMKKFSLTREETD